MTRATMNREERRREAGLGLAAPWWTRGHRLRAWVVAAGGAGLLAGCSLDGLLNNDKLPPSVTDPAVTQTPAGALTVYNGTILQLQYAFAGSGSGTLGGVGVGSNGGAFVVATGLLSDELEQPTGAAVKAADPLNARTLFGATDDDGNVKGAYSGLQRIRGQAGQAIELLTRYVPEQPALAGHMYAMEAYAEIMLAELFCSGIPLSTIDYDGDYTFRPGSTTTEVFTHALALLDTGLTLAADSTRFVNLVHLAQGRALLGLGEYAAAAAAVAAVPDAYSYAASYTATLPANAGRNFASQWSGVGFTPWRFGEADGEGLNGLDYRTSGDPRTTATYVEYSDAELAHGWSAYRTDKYPTIGDTPVVLASGIEARLIQAEAQLAAGDGTWLTTLNALRTDGTFTVDSQAVVDNTVSPPDTTWTYDTLWHAGIGGTAGLRPLDDPGTPDGRVDLLFRERAFWLFLTGHRQGDLRRLIRQYHRDPETVYPTGPYSVLGNFYGTDVVAPVPMTEKAANPLFTGCASTRA